MCPGKGATGLPCATRATAPLAPHQARAPSLPRTPQLPQQSSPQSWSCRLPPPHSFSSSRTQAAPSLPWLQHPQPRELQAHSVTFSKRLHPPSLPPAAALGSTEAPLGSGQRGAGSHTATHSSPSPAPGPGQAGSMGPIPRASPILAPCSSPQPGLAQSSGPTPAPCCSPQVFYLPRST